MSNPAYQGISIYDGPGNTLTYKQDSVTSIWSIPELGAQIAGSAVPQYVQYMGANKSGNLVGMLLDASGNLLVDVSSQSYTNYGSPAVSALNVYVVNPSSGGGGTQYTDGTVESSGAFSITVAGSYNGTGVVGLRSDSSDNLLVRLTDSVHPITAAVSAWGVAPTGTFVMGVNAELMAGSVALTAQAGGYLNTALYTGTTAVTTATFGTTNSGSGILTNASLFIGTTVASAATAGVQLVGIEGHAGGVFDAAQGGATPANLIQIGGVIGGVGVGTTVGAINVSGTGTQLVQDVVDAAASSINFFGAISSTSALTAITGAYPVLSIQPNNGSILFRLRGFDVFSNGSICAFQLLRNATLGGGTSFVAGPTGSNMKYDVSSTTVSGGVLVDAGFVGEQKTRDKLLAIYMKGTTTTDILTLVLTPTGSSASVGAAFQWSEQAAAL